MKVNTSLMDYTTQDIAVDSYGAIFTLTFRLTIIWRLLITIHHPTDYCCYGESCLLDWNVCSECN